jgi:proline dehydrogenase
MEQSRLSQQVTGRFVAGRTLADEVHILRKLAAEGISSSADFLGENVRSLEEAQYSRKNYLDALEQIRDLPATVSIKLTQFGLDFSADACFENASTLVARAADSGTRVEVDMESSEYTQRTLDVVCRLQQAFPGHVRVAIQAYLHRSEDDVRLLGERQIPVRLCKGAYREPASVAFARKDQVDANYLKLTRLLLNEGTYPAIASHDEAVIRETLRHVAENRIATDCFEFQMLYGIRRDLQRELVTKGHRLRLYVPYGDAWYPYFMRRLAERPANVLFIARNLVRK